MKRFSKWLENEHPNFILDEGTGISWIDNILSYFTFFNSYSEDAFRELLRTASDPNNPKAKEAMEKIEKSNEFRRAHPAKQAHLELLIQRQHDIAARKAKDAKRRAEAEAEAERIDAERKLKDTEQYSAGRSTGSSYKPTGNWRRADSYDRGMRIRGLDG
jgi:hypothetical protein